MSSPTARGHRALPHTADVRIEAWARTRDACIAEAVRALVATFARVPDDSPHTEAAVLDITVDGHEDALVRVLDEVVYLVDTRGVPVDADVRTEDDGVHAAFRLVPLDAVEVVGAAPKAVALHGLRFGADDRGWSCEVLVDV